MTTKYMFKYKLKMATAYFLFQQRRFEYVGLCETFNFMQSFVRSYYFLKHIFHNIYVLQNLDLRQESGKVLKLCSGIAIYHALSKRKTCLACILKAVEDLFLLRNERQGIKRNGLKFYFYIKNSNILYVQS